MVQRLWGAKICPEVERKIVLPSDAESMSKELSFGAPEESDNEPELWISIALPRPRGGCLPLKKVTRFVGPWYDFGRVVGVAGFNDSWPILARGSPPVIARAVVSLVGFWDCLRASALALITSSNCMPQACPKKLCARPPIAALPNLSIKSRSVGCSATWNSARASLCIWRIACKFLGVLGRLNGAAAKALIGSATAVPIYQPRTCRGLKGTMPVVSRNVLVGVGTLPSLAEHPKNHLIWKKAV